VKNRRHMRIREMISQRDVETQEELVHALEQAGLAVTQATISRDIKELQLVKVIGSSGRYKYALPASTARISLETLRRKLSEVFVSMGRANNLLVLKVAPGNAHAVGAMLDSMNMAGLVGTLAGDDTLLLICSDNSSAEEIEGWLSA